MTRLSKPGEDVRKGAWDAEEDEKLRKYVATYGTGQWRSVGKKAGLQRCGKSCRLRWTNYLRPDIRHGSFTLEEEDLIVKLHAAHGSRWSLIAAQMPGRTDNDVKNHWNTRLKKKLCDMGIDPVTHKPIAELLRDLAGTLAQSSEAGNQEAEETARRCFRDSLVNKAVQDFGKNNPALVSQFTNQSVHQTEELVSTQEIHHPDRAQKFSHNNSGYNSHSMDTSSSTQDAPSRRSASPPLSANLEHSNQHRYQTNNAGQSQKQGASGMVVESSFGQITYFPSTQVQSEHHLSSSQEPGSNSELNVSPRKGNQSVAGPSRSLQPIRTVSTRWLSSRRALPQEEFLNAGAVQFALSRFGSELQIQLGAQSHSEESDYMQGSDVTKPPAISTSGGSKEDISTNLGCNQQAGSLQQEGFGYRSFSGPLISPTTSGNSLMDTATQHALSGYAGHCPTVCQFNSGNLISPNSANLPSFNSPLGGTPTGMRLHEFEVPSPRVVLWDFQAE